MLNLKKLLQNRRILFIISLTLSTYFSSGKAFAQDNSFITIVNPVRISSYTKSYLESFRAEYKEIKNRNLSATWPVTYDVLLKQDLVKELEKMNNEQELGIFLEVTPELCKDAGVTYNQTDSWHRATSLFLSGYTQKDRKKLIDTVFAKFKQTFGYYPVSVGSWWTDSYSLSYMEKKYGITGTLNISDQYDLDGYALWGTWWSVPYYPSKINAALPAQSKDDKLDIVTFRWAARDPLNGYNNTNNKRKQPSLYSLQDYSTIELDKNYLNNLTQVFAQQLPQNKFGQATIGLEADLDPHTYSVYFADHLDLQAVKNTRIMGMKDFSEWYKNAFPDLSPNHIIYSEDTLGGSLKAIWYQTPFYRIGFSYHSKTQETKIIDLRNYYSNYLEPDYSSPNKELSLSINLPFIVDSVILPSSQISLQLGVLKDIGKNELVFEKGTVKLENDKVITPEKTYVFKRNYEVGKEGTLQKNFSFTLPFSLKRTFQFLPTTLFSPVPQNTFISQDEYNALTVLKRLEKGNVLVYESSCLKCTFQSKYKPTAATGNKSYVSKYSGQHITKDLSFLLSKSSADARKILKDKQVTYIYLAKYEDYIETLPFLPQDLLLERMYSSENTEIWKVK